MNSTSQKIFYLDNLIKLDQFTIMSWYIPYTV